MDLPRELRGLSSTFVNRLESASPPTANMSSPVRVGGVMGWVRLNGYNECVMGCVCDGVGKMGWVRDGVGTMRCVMGCVIGWIQRCWKVPP